MLRLLRLWRHRGQYPERYRYLAGLVRAAALPAAELLERQRRDLQAIVRFATSHSDYYRQRYEGPFSRFLRDGDPAALPILTKDDLRLHRDAMLPHDIPVDTVKLGHTGGSTGQPVSFYYNQAKHERMLAGMMRGFMMSGWRPGQRVLYLWGAQRDARQGGVFGNRGDGFLALDRTLAAVEYREATLAGWARQIRGWRPVLLYGYASALDALARFWQTTRLTPPRSLLGVYSTAEMLYDNQRTAIEQAFGCKVFNQYGCREVPNIAWECRAGNMHIFADLVFLDTCSIDDESRLLVTSLTDRVNPFIRYDVGDSGRLLHEQCDCGSPFPLLEMGVCRHNDLVRLADGRLIHPAFFNQLLYGRREILQYQWVQVELRHMVLNLVAGQPLPSADVDGLRRRLRDDLDLAMMLDVRYHSTIPRTAAGKHRFVIGMG